MADLKKLSEFYAACAALLGADVASGDVVLWLDVSTGTLKKMTRDELRSAILSAALQAANNLDDLADAATARTNLGLGTAAVVNLTALLQAANNLSDVGNASTARTNLGLGTAAVANLTALLQAANNLSDLANASTARTNLGLGTAAVANLTALLQAANNLSDLANAGTARTNLGLGTLATQNGTISDYAPLASPALTGNPTAPTQSAGNNSTRLATTAYCDGAIATAVAGLLELKGSTNCSANPNYPAASAGDTYLVSVAGKIGGASGKSVDVGDVYIATADNAGGTEASVGTSWTVLEHNLAGALVAANNLSDLASVSTARTNLGLGTAAVANLTALLQAANNLSDVANAGTARTNLGLGTAATRDAGAANGVAPLDGSSLMPDAFLRDGLHYLPGSLPGSDGDFVLNRSSGTFTWAAAAVGGGGFTPPGGSPDFSGDWTMLDDGGQAGHIDLWGVGNVGLPHFSLNHEDADAGDRTTELATIAPGTIVKLEHATGTCWLTVNRSNAGTDPTLLCFLESRGGFLPTNNEDVTVSFWLP